MRVLLPSFLSGMVMSVSKMYVLHLGHHTSTLLRSESYMLMTVGRRAGSDVPTMLMVLVMRSGIDVRRLAPRALSLRKPETMGLDLKSFVQ